MATPSESSPSTATRRNQEVRTRRYEPIPLYLLAERLKRQGLKLGEYHGPWNAIRRLLRRPGRNEEQSLPIVTNGVVEIAVDTAEHAVDLAGVLNVAGVDDLDPVPNLRPPADDLVRA